MTDTKENDILATLDKVLEEFQEAGKAVAEIYRESIIPMKDEIISAFINFSNQCLEIELELKEILYENTI